MCLRHEQAKLSLMPIRNPVSEYKPCAINIFTYNILYILYISTVQYFANAVHFKEDITPYIDYPMFTKQRRGVVVAETTQIQHLQYFNSRSLGQKLGSTPGQSLHRIQSGPRRDCTHQCCSILACKESLIVLIL